MLRMIEITASAQAYFRKLLQTQGDGAVGIRLQATQAGTPHADAQLSFCDPEDVRADDRQLDCEGFALFVEDASVAWFAEAQIDFVADDTGGQLNIRAPRLKGMLPAADADLATRVQYLIDTEINPQLAAHRGRVSLEAVTAQGEVVLRFGGGCHGCGMVDVTLRGGIEKTLRARLPEITAVRDATDHASGQRPWYRPD